MSSSGNPALRSTPWRVTKLMLNRPKSGNEDLIVEHGLRLWRVIGSPDFPPSKEDLRARILRSIRRSIYPAGYRNQMAAIVKSGDRRELLKNISVPTLVIHGKADVLIPVDGGIDTAKNIKDAEIKLIEGMGHDLPKELLPRLTQMIDRHISNI